jgi:UDP-glucuronate 4-epimerase
LVISKFTRAITKGEPIQCYGNGSTRRDYTYIADVVNAFSAAIAYSASDYEIINVGTNRSVSLQDLVKALEIALGKTAAIESAAAQPGDAQVTLANIEKAYGLIGYVPTVSLQAGISQFVDWMKAFG